MLGNVWSKYLNKEVIVEEKLYNSISTIADTSFVAKSFSSQIASQNRMSGILTNYDDEYIELDNQMLIARKHIYRIILKTSEN